nr:hypothetical protein [uncultured Marvinbryantia sp.]
MGSMIIPQCKTMKDLLAEYVALYGKDNWALSTYDGNVSLINNYILPIIGDEKYGDNRKNTWYQKKYHLHRQLLHAYQMKFPELTGTLSHLSGQEFTAPLPEDFQRILTDAGCDMNDMEEENGNLEFAGTARFSSGGSDQPVKRGLSGKRACADPEDTDADHPHQN